MKQDLADLKRQYDNLESRRKEIEERLEKHSKNRQLLLGIGRMQNDPFALQSERSAQREWASVRQQQAALLKKRPWWMRLLHRNGW